ncbi:isopenicillin-N N-acyltransferase like protein [Haladaptatus litoreus]|uniref:Isopenicillin-N N-acyltransferase like protein n=1 Tax=Haladaptatus litoreus TaxID=553468 RepID=A0A1N7EZ75_9EURY|nr:C45 family peptidase [Haladaptatus litoreus]SIR93235.1 isopenicillin-N N-acyltransferase like protein [Haladaptatus litoreus]
MTSLPHLVLTGSPYERGLTHGEAFAAEIRANVETYLTRFAHHGATEEAVRRQASEYVPLIEEWNADYASELRGIADGSGVMIEEITLLNVRYEILYASYSDQTTKTHGCTSFGLLPMATADGETYIGQNWDWAAPIADTLLVAEIHQSAKSDHIAITEAGIVGGKMGVNEQGIGLVINGLVSPDDGDHPFRKPFHLRCREILDATRYDSALESIVATPHACSANYVVGHGDGEVIDIETSPNRTDYIYPQNGIVTHANHFMTPDFESRMERQLPDSLYRANRLRRLFEHRRGEIDSNIMKSALRDHFGRPASICRHEDPDAPSEECSQTDTSVILNLDDCILHATYGPPCDEDYQIYRLCQ